MDWSDHRLPAVEGSSSSAAASAPAAPAAACNADVPGRFGDPGDRSVPGSAASASAAAAGARARLSVAEAKNWAADRKVRRPFLLRFDRPSEAVTSLQLR